jgi:hypothetical protein
MYNNCRKKTLVECKNVAYSAQLNIEPELIKKLPQDVK